MCSGALIQRCIEGHAELLVRACFLSSGIPSGAQRSFQPELAALDSQVARAHGRPSLEGRKRRPLHHR